MAEPGDELTEELREAIIESNVAGTGQVQVERSGDSSPRQGRRVILRCNPSGEYQILWRNRVIQSFCPEFEDIANFVLPQGIEQQVRIHIMPIGSAREIPPQGVPREDSLEDGVALRTIVHPRPAGLSEESLEELEIEIPGDPALHPWQNDAIEIIRQEIRGLRAALQVIANLGLPR